MSILILKMFTHSHAQTFNHTETNVVTNSSQRSPYIKSFAHTHIYKHGHNSLIFTSTFVTNTLKNSLALKHSH